MLRFFLLLLLALKLGGLAMASPLTINIDNPQFRRIVAAVPSFIVCPKVGSENNDALVWSKEGSGELRSLLSFSGLFNHLAPVAYEEPLNEVVKGECQGPKGSFFSRAGGGLPQEWKTIGVESLTLAKIIPAASGLALEIKTYDVQRQSVLLGKRYGNLQLSDLKQVIRRYANLLLEAYTGKPGIFFSKLAFVGRVSKGDEKQVFICDFDGGNLRKLTSESVPHLSPHWSPDGKYITYTSYERGNPDLYIYEVATGTKRLLSSYHGLNSGAQWAANGKLIALTGSYGGDTDIFTMVSGGGKRRRLITGSGLDVDPTFSPDGRFLAFVSGRFGNPHIFLAELSWSSDTQVRVIKDTRLTYAGWYNSTPDWSPDSKKLVFAGYDKDIDRYDIFMMNENGKELERLTLKTGDNENPSFAPNGQMIAFQSNRVGQQDRKGPYQLWIMHRDGSNQKRLDLGLYEAFTPDWSGPLKGP